MHNDLTVKLSVTKTQSLYMLPSMRSAKISIVPRRRDYPFDIRAHISYGHSILEVYACFEKGRGGLIRAHTSRDKSTILAPASGSRGAAIFRARN